MIHTAFLGDIVLASALLRTLRARNPQATIRFITTEIGREVLTPNPWNIEIEVFAKRGQDQGTVALFRRIRALRAWGPQLVLNLHRYFRSSLLALGSGAADRRGFKDAPLAFLQSLTVDRSQFEYESARYLALLGEAKPEELLPELFSDTASESAADALLAELKGAKFLAIAPSSVWATKRWLPERFAAVARKAWRDQGIRSVILGADTDTDRDVAGRVEYYFTHTPGQTKQLEGLPLNLSGKTSLGVMKAVLGRAKALLANDSAPLHMGIARGIPVVGVFGPTTKELGFFPLAPEGQAAAVEVPLYCRPCGQHGHERCPEAHFRCMKELEVGPVWRELARHLCE